MTHAEQPQQPESLTVDEALQKGIACHQAGQLQEAERHYRAILQVQSHHADANHNLGVVAVQVNRVEAGLPHFKAALEANPNQAQYWLSYIDALIQAGQTEVARKVLEQGRQHGLEGEVEASLAERLGPNTEEINALVALFGEGRYEEAATQARTMTERFPQHGFGWKVSGAVLKQIGRSAEALAPLQKAAALSPGDAEAHFNLGLVLHDLGRLEEAEASYRRALQINPEYAGAHYNLGITLMRLGRLEEAEGSYRSAVQIRPQYADAYCNLGAILMNQGRFDEALVCYQQQLQLSPGNDSALHQIASIVGSTTERAPSDYVERVFDGCADDFDKHLLHVLNYQAPDRLATLIAKHATPSAEKWRVLDLGCGTGLVGLAISPFAQHLVGVDLSSKMLEKAAARKVYQRLERMELLAMMEREPASSYDVIIAADVFVYLGKLDEVVDATKRLLKPGGVVAFTVEALGMVPGTASGPDYRLEQTGRYTHSADYLRRLGAANGFLPREMVEAQIRVEKGNPVNSYLVLWQG